MAFDFEQLEPTSVSTDNDYKIKHWGKGMPKTCLLPEISWSSDRRYRHQLIKARVERHRRFLNILRQICEQAHADFIRHFRSLAGISLDPLGEIPNDPCEGYPEQLNHRTLMGYFGEVFAGIIAEHFSPLGESGWEVPLHLFRFHLEAFHQLQTINQSGAEAGIIPGRRGDDCLAFKRNRDGQITHSLMCEAKCTADHDSGAINEAHQKLSSRPPKPVDLLQLVAALKDYSDEDSRQWAESLLQLFLDRPIKDYETCDMVSYVCGRAPIRSTSWMPTDTPHSSYTGPRRLESVEVQLSDINQLVKEVYKKS